MGYEGLIFLGSVIRGNLEGALKRERSAGSHIEVKGLDTPNISRVTHKYTTPRRLARTLPRSAACYMKALFINNAVIAN